LAQCGDETVGAIPPGKAPKRERGSLNRSVSIRLINLRLSHLFNLPILIPSPVVTGNNTAAPPGRAWGKGLQAQAVRQFIDEFTVSCPAPQTSPKAETHCLLGLLLVRDRTNYISQARRRPRHRLQLRWNCARRNRLAQSCCFSWFVQC
jgi:hypothetical protein